MPTTDHQHTPTEDELQLTNPSGQVPSTPVTPAQTTQPIGLDEDLGRSYRDKPEQSWTSFDRSEAYLDSRPIGGVFNPAAEFGDPDWREPESDAEAAARTAHLAAQPRDPQTSDWLQRVAALSDLHRDTLEAELQEADEELCRVGHFRDPDEIQDVRVRRDELAARMELEQVAEPVDRELEDDEVHAGEFDEDQFGEDEFDEDEL